MHLPDFFLSFGCADDRHGAHAVDAVEHVDQLVVENLVQRRIALLDAFLLWGPRLHRSLQNADHAFDSLEMVASQLVQADIPALLSDMDQLAAKGKDSLEAMEKAAEVLEKIDMDQLNRAIADLQKAVSPLAKLFG